MFQVCAHGIQSILDKRLIAGGRQKKGGRQTIFFTPLNLCGENFEEEALGKSLTVSRKVHYRSCWTRNQDTENCVKLFRAQDQCLEFWQTTSNPIVVNDQVPADCICRVISQNGEQILYETMSTPRPAPKVILRSRCRIEQEQYSVTAFFDAWKDWRGTQASEQEKEMKIETLENSVHRAAGNSMQTLILPILRLIFESKECQMILCNRMRIG